ncbi:Protein ECM11 [Nakaseomyces glabratus]|uniref:Protein ECM11 n=1 Tax=Candida glabrata TaxID=5478 RepID=A0A0W0C5X1_CANGB|nr:Protein ECM11 [Nakaseomyces glabratus]KTA99702.1 Protein ECM11 [Nakaseomyces glabratus]KTB09262.1 Protein ECM11 [Nakaseomyces glabratus]KTB11552.1 Protein ECM11 [Nakaseomyces glabratus]
MCNCTKIDKTQALENLWSWCVINYISSAACVLVSVSSMFIKSEAGAIENNDKKRYKVNKEKHDTHRKKKDKSILESFLLVPGQLDGTSDPAKFVPGLGLKTPIKDEGNISLPLVNLPPSEMRSRWRSSGSLFGPQEVDNNQLPKVKKSPGVKTPTSMKQRPHSTQPEETKPADTLVTPTSPLVEERQNNADSLKPAEDPGPFKKQTRLLYEVQNDMTIDDDNMTEIFPGLEKEEEKTYCRQSSLWSLDQWIEEGENILRAHQEIFIKIIKKRIELSYNFNSLITVLNDRAEALCKHGNVIDSKLEKVKKLGNEILNIL